MTILLPIINWLLGSRMGIYICISLLIMILLVIVYWRIYNKGVISVKTELIEKSITNVLDRLKADDEIFKLDADSRRIRLRKWAIRDT